MRLFQDKFSIYKKAGEPLLGRNYLKVGFYTDIMFPEKGVRFIAVNNSIDSEKMGDNDFAPCLNIMNKCGAPSECGSKRM